MLSFSLLCLYFTFVSVHTLFHVQASSPVRIKTSGPFDRQEEPKEIDIPEGFSAYSGSYRESIRHLFTDRIASHTRRPEPVPITVGPLTRPPGGGQLVSRDIVPDLTYHPPGPTKGKQAETVAERRRAQWRRTLPERQFDLWTTDPAFDLPPHPFHLQRIEQVPGDDAVFHTFADKPAKLNKSRHAEKARKAFARLNAHTVVATYGAVEKNAMSVWKGMILIHKHFTPGDPKFLITALMAVLTFDDADFGKVLLERCTLPFTELELLQLAVSLNAVNNAKTLLESVGFVPRVMTSTKENYELLLRHLYMKDELFLYLLNTGVYSASAFHYLLYRRVLALPAADVKLRLVTELMTSRDLALFHTSRRILMAPESILQESHFFEQPLLSIAQRHKTEATFAERLRKEVSQKDVVNRRIAQYLQRLPATYVFEADDLLGLAVVASNHITLLEMWFAQYDVASNVGYSELEAVMEQMLRNDRMHAVKNVAALPDFDLRSVTYAPGVWQAYYPELSLEMLERNATLKHLFQEQDARVVMALELLSAGMHEGNIGTLSRLGDLVSVELMGQYTLHLTSLIKQRLRAKRALPPLAKEFLFAAANMGIILNVWDFDSLLHTILKRGDTYTQLVPDVQPDGHQVLKEVNVTFVPFQLDPPLMIRRAQLPPHNPL